MNENFEGVIIDPGHGGVDSGARGNDTLEKDYTLLISKYMYDRFKELGVPVEITRDNDITLNPSDRVNKAMSFYGNNPNVVLISNHVNAGGGDGAEVIYALRNSSGLADMILNNIGDTGQNKRRVYQRRLPSNSKLDYYYIIRDTGRIEPLIIEYGFIDNKDDLDFIKNYYKELAEAVIKGVLTYKGIPYSEPDMEVVNEYKVIKGDTLYGIAKKLDTSVDELKKINNLSNNNLYIGQILKIPTKEVDIGNTDIYTVKRGDTLYGIANKYGISLAELKAINDKDNDIISIGEILKVPSGISNVNIYIVGEGDTLYGIAKKFNTTVDIIKNANGLTSNMISVGDKLIIPIDNVLTYMVKAGDTLYGISKKFNKSIDEIKKLNNLTQDVLEVGKLLILE